MKTNMNIQKWNVVPSSFITKGKQRLKQHNNTVYLNNGDEFELEFYNPTQLKVLAKIELNGKSIGSGIIIRPGERVYLERYLDDARKFLFETYNVNGDSDEVRNAIMNNGNVRVKFFKETPNIQITHYNYTQQYPWGLTYPNENIIGTSISSNSTGILSTYYNNTTTNTVANTTFTSSNNVPCGYVKSKLIETGSVEKGSHSNQTFTYGSTTFNPYSDWTNEWKILPMSQKEIYSEDLYVKQYCSGCSRKLKKEYKFCPNCGTKF